MFGRGSSSGCRQWQWHEISERAEVAVVNFGPPHEVGIVRLHSRVCCVGLSAAAAVRLWRGAICWTDRVLAYAYATRATWLEVQTLIQLTLAQMLLQHELDTAAPPPQSGLCGFVLRDSSEVNCNHRARTARSETFECSSVRVLFYHRSSIDFCYRYLAFSGVSCSVLDS